MEGVKGRERGRRGKERRGGADWMMMMGGAWSWDG